MMIFEILYHMQQLTELTREVAELRQYKAEAEKANRLRGEDESFSTRITPTNSFVQSARCTNPVCLEISDRAQAYELVSECLASCNLLYGSVEDGGKAWVK